VDAEKQRLDEARAGIPWRKWGPYLSERQWGTVREDYSDTGAAWDYFTHDQARSRTYRWGEDGLAGVSDDKQRLCFALALWNGADPILKERLFGLTNSEGNHGEDVKEYYFYLDSTPTHSSMKYLYKYSQRAYPYSDLVDTNHKRSRHEPEYELIDTGVFDDDRYFDVFVDYAKADPEDLLIQITVCNRGPEDAPLHVLPSLWFRNTWARDGAAPRPLLRNDGRIDGAAVIAASHPEIGEYELLCADAPELWFTENESNTQHLFGTPNASPFVKDAFHERLVHGTADAVNPAGTGTKAVAHYPLVVPAGGERVLRLRLRRRRTATGAALGPAFDDVLATRRQEADAFYDGITPPSVDADARRIFRQALAGMLWSKQYYLFDLDVWLDEHGAHPLKQGKHGRVRNADWFHMLNDDVISMPDKWEYPWYAAWDLSFHCIALAIVDMQFAKQQLTLMLNELYLHPSGQLPAYEWNFGDVNPPVHAFATLFIYRNEKDATGKGDRAWLAQAFQKLLVNFTWWVNRKDPTGKNVCEGGFLGLDNIGATAPPGWPSSASACCRSRSISRHHAEHPFVFQVNGQDYRVEYQPAESTSGLFGGNSNWRGPGLVSGEPADRPRAADARLVLRRILHHRVPDRVGTDDDAVRSRAGDLEPYDRHLSPRPGRAAAGIRSVREVPERSALAGPDPVLRVLPRRQRRGDRGQPPDRLDRHRREPDPALRAPHRGGRARHGGAAADRLRAARGQRHLMTNPIARIPAGALAALLLLTACGTPVGVKRMDPTAVQRQLTRSILSSDSLSNSTRNALFQHDLTTRWEDDPAGAIAVLQDAVAAGKARRNDVYALAEISFAYAEARNDLPYFRSAAVYAWLFLFPGDDTKLDPLDGRARTAADLYNRGLARARRALRPAAERRLRAPCRQLSGPVRHARPLLRRLAARLDGPPSRQVHAGRRARGRGPRDPLPLVRSRCAARREHRAARPGKGLH